MKASLLIEIQTEATSKSAEDPMRCVRDRN